MEAVYEKIRFDEYINDNCPKCSRELETKKEKCFGGIYIVQETSFCKCGWWNYDFLYEDSNGNSDDGNTVVGQGIENIPWIENLGQQGMSSIHPIIK